MTTTFMGDDDQIKKRHHIKLRKSEKEIYILYILRMDFPE